MRSSILLSARAAFLALGCTLTLAACGGGGGGGGTSPALPPATPTPNPVTAQAAARTSSQATLSAMELGVTNSSSVSGLLAVGRRAQAIVHGRRPLAVTTCTNQAIVGAPVTNADGSQTITETDYYDAACTLKEDVVTVTAPASLVNNPNATTATLPFTVTTYSQAQNVTSYLSGDLTITATTSGATLSFRVTVAVAPGGATIAQFGMTCTANTSGTTESCGFAAIASGAGTQNGAAISVNEALVATATQLTLTENLTSSLYTGTALALQQGTGTAWTVTGGTTLDTLTGTITETITQTTTSGTIAMSDPTKATSVAGTISATGTMFTVTENGTLEATVVVDTFGNGAITYAGGTTAAITYWTVLG